MLPGDDRFAVAQDDPGSICLLFLIAEALQADLGQQAGAVRLHIRRRYEHVLEVNGRHDAQGDFSVDAAIGQIVDAAAKGGRVRPFGRIHRDGDLVFAVKADKIRDLHAECRIAALVLPRGYAVDKNAGKIHHAFKVEEEALSLPLRLKRKPALVAGYKAKSLIIKVIVGQLNVGVRQAKRLIAFRAGWPVQVSLL